MSTKEDSKKEEKVKIKEMIKEKTTSYILAAFGLVAGLAWNEAIKSLIEFIFPQSGNSLLAKFVYAALLTVVVVYVSIYLNKLFRKEN